MEKDHGQGVGARRCVAVKWYTCKAARPTKYYKKQQSPGHQPEALLLYIFDTL